MPYQVQEFLLVLFNISAPLWAIWASMVFGSMISSEGVSLASDQVRMGLSVENATYGVPRFLRRHGSADGRLINATLTLRALESCRLAADDCFRGKVLPHNSSRRLDTSGDQWSAPK